MEETIGPGIRMARAKTPPRPGRKPMILPKTTPARSSPRAEGVNTISKPFNIISIKLLFPYPDKRDKCVNEIVL
jgi:hypothetical protein